MKIKLVIADTDENYTGKLAEHLNSLYGEKLELSTFTRADVLREFLDGNRADVILLSESLGLDPEEIEVPGRKAAYLAETNGIDTMNGAAAIGKYQRLDILYKEILGLYSEIDTGMVFKRKESSARVVSFYGAGGGMGQTTMAAAYAVFLAKQGKRVLYLNLELLCSEKAFFKGEGQFSFDDVIFAVKSKKANLAMKLESSVKQDGTGVFFYEPCKNIFDIQELGAEDIEKILGTICKAGIFDEVVMDQDFVLNEKFYAGVNQSDLVVLVGDGSEIGNEKLKRAAWLLQKEQEEKRIESQAGLSLVYNRFSNKDGQGMEIEGLEVIGGVPKLEHISAKERIMQISGMEFWKDLEKRVEV